MISTVNINLCKDVNPCPQGGCSYVGSNGQNSVFSAWNSGAYASDYGPSGAMIYHGGGDGDYWGNEVYALPLDTGIWERVNEPSEVEPPGVQIFDPPECEHADGRHGAPHSYDAYEYLSAAEGGGPKGSFIILKSTFVKTTNSSGRTHFVDLATGSEGRFSTNRAQFGSNHLPTVCKDTLRKRFWMTYSGNVAGLHYLDYMGDKTWVQAKAWFTGPYPSGYPTSDYYPPADLMITCFGNSLLATKLYDIASDRILIQMTGVPPNWNATRLGFCYADTLNAFFVRDSTQPAKMYRIDAPDPSQNALTTPWHVSEIDLTGVAVPSSSGIFKRMRWTKNHGLVWCDSVNSPTYSYTTGGVSILVPSSLGLIEL